MHTHKHIVICNVCGDEDGPYPSFFPKATATIPANPPRMPGMPCRLWTPQVSWMPRLDARMGCRREKEGPLLQPNSVFYKRWSAHLLCKDGWQRHFCVIYLILFIIDPKIFSQIFHHSFPNPKMTFDFCFAGPTVQNSFHHSLLFFFLWKKTKISLFNFAPSLDFALTVRYLKPTVEMMPATNPISIAP